ncbi:MAG TPA: GtrA family protein [Anaerolineae bacterium]|nr:GtrA family protein [Anaerolineae bacterium]
MTSTPLSATTRREARRFVKFLVVGAVGFVIDFGAFNFLYRVLNFQATPALTTVAQAISFTLAVASNFFWNRRWTYPESRSKPVLKQFSQFFILNAIGLTIRTLLFTALGGFFNTVVASTLDGPLAFLTRFATDTLNFTLQQLGHNLTLAFVVIVVMLWNFFSNRFITYSDVKIGH